MTLSSTALPMDDTIGHPGPSGGRSIVFLVQVPFSQRDFQRNGIEFLAAQGYAVTVIDVSRIAVPNLPAPPEQTDFPSMRLVRIADRRDLDRHQGELASASLIVSHVGSGFVTPDNLPVMRAMARSRRPTLMFSINATPWWQTAPQVFGAGGRLTRILGRLRQLNLLATALNRLPLSLLGVRPYDYVVHGGRKSHARRRLLTPGTRSIQAHSMDYDLFLEQVSAPRDAPSSPFAVFLDQYIGYHPDAVEGQRHPERPERFYPLLRAFFDRIESQLGLEVVIAPHPRADYSDKPGLFGKRRMIGGATSRLVSQSRLVVSSYSTAVGMAMLFEKPVVLCATQPMLANAHACWAIVRLAQDLGVSPTLIDQDYSLDDAEDFDRERYETYIADYIKVPGSPKRQIWSLIVERLKADGIL